MAALQITVPDAQVPRARTAIGAILTLRDGNGALRDATAAEVSQFLADYLKASVLQYEQRSAEVTARQGVAPITATGA